ncbi:hypothetical protein ACFFRR_010452 [Megaselia abdita]
MRLLSLTARNRIFLRGNSTWSGRIATGYQPSEVETKPRSWTQPAPKDSPKFHMILPPPNVTGQLHLGHAFMSTIQDTICRWKRSQGFDVQWIPGTDHAGIATQVVVEKKLLKERGVSRHDIGRDEFLKEVWKWKEAKGETIIDDLKNLGCTLDYDREYFTMDPRLSKAVNRAFIELFEAGLIKREKSMINWSCALESTISDIEVDTLEVKGPTAVSVPGYDKSVTFGVLYDVAYKIVGTEDEIVVSTTRPETILGDVAIAVNPLDERYSHFRKVDAQVWHPFRNEPIPIIFDLGVDKDFGTGAVKITPAHDKLDFEIGNRHMLEPIQVFKENGCVGNFEGFESLPRFDVRYKILNALASLKLLKSKKDHSMNVPICSRSKDVVEYMIRDQWFLDCKEMAEEALHAVKSGNLQIQPPNFEYEWEKWLTDTKDWCISRQLWWGHQIPAYSMNHNGKEVWVAAESEKEAVEKAFEKLKIPLEKVSLKRDQDVLDTWFSSGLLPFTVKGWPDEKDFEPLDIMETGHDIIFFWVARMVMLSQKLTGKIPFRSILLNGIVCDAHGRKMSKSLGNVVLPKQVIDGISLEGLQSEIKNSFENGILSQQEFEKSLESVRKTFSKGIPECGKDALRFTLLQYNLKNHFINFDVNECNTNRLFFNKIWQATRYFFNSLDKLNYSEDCLNKSTFNPSKMDKWILNCLRETTETCNEAYNANNFHFAVNALKQFFYSNVCDVYIETTKSGMTREDEISLNHCKTLSICLTEGLKLMSPLTPHLSDELLKVLPILNNYTYWSEDQDLVENVQKVLEVCQFVRQSKSQHKISKKHDPILYLFPQDEKAEELFQNFEEEIKLLTQCNNVKIFKESSEEKLTVYSTAGHLSTFGIQTNNTFQKKDTHLNSKKEKKIKEDLDRLLLTIENEGYQKSANEDVKRRHLERINQLRTELEAIQQFIS